MSVVQMTALSGPGVSFVKSIGSGPSLEVFFGFPKTVGGIEDVIFPFRTSKQIERDEPGNLFQVGSPGLPNAFEFGFVSLDYAEPVHCKIIHLINLASALAEANFLGPVAKEAVGCAVHFSVAP